MGESSEARIFDSFRPYLRLLQAYNFENFRPNNPNIRNNVRDAIGFTLFISLSIILIFLQVWCLVESGGDLGKIAILIPMLNCNLALALMYPALIIKNRIINGTINRLEQVIDRSE